tara:strand:+ start:1796 stop:2317 length:522 start_codon:yes stop_codon:yes gene_type:complete
MSMRYEIIPEVAEKCEGIDDGTCAAVTLDGNAATCTGAGACDYTAAVTEACASSGSDAACAAVTNDMPGNNARGWLLCREAGETCVYTGAVAEACVATETCPDRDGFVAAAEVGTPFVRTASEANCDSSGCVYTPYQAPDWIPNPAGTPSTANIHNLGFQNQGSACTPERCCE